MIVGVSIALGVELYNHHELFLPFLSGSCESFKQNSTVCYDCNSIDQHIVQTIFPYMPLAVISSTVTVVLVIVFCSVFCLCCDCQNKLGRIFH